MLTNSEEFRPCFQSLNDRRIEQPLKLDENVFINEYITRYLKDYQIEGVRFLYKAYKEQRGAILADEMGLGKTIQVIAFLAAVLAKKGLPSDLDYMLLDCIKKQRNITLTTNQMPKIKPFLICCPTTVISNWINELDTWGYFAVSKFHSANERKETLKKLENERCEIVLTSHETARIHINELSSFEWSAIVVDEFHKIKNDVSLVSQAFHEFTTKTRIGLSGTILQNDLIELWSLLNWVNPGCLGSKEAFKLNYCKPILVGQRQNATKLQLLRKVERTDTLKKLKKQWVLRRTKNILSNQLPQKIDQVVYCKLSKFQIDLLKKLRETELVEFMINRNNPCKCGGTYITKECGCFQHLVQIHNKVRLKLVGVFLKAANHPGLFLEGINDDEVDEILLDAFPQALEHRREFFDVANCGKMKVLDSLLDALKRQNAKVLLFSYSVKLLDIIERYVNDKEYSYLRLDGQTKPCERQGLVNRFNQDETMFLFLISTKSGGVGLNITSANVVVVFDPNWNPTHDLQAQDRAYRIGQKRDVHVYRLISSGCIEENIYLRQIYKMHLSKECVEDESSKRLFNLSAKNKRGEFLGLENIFALDEASESCKTRDILKRYAAIEKGIAGLDVSNFVETTPQESLEKNDDHNKEQKVDEVEEEFFYNGENTFINEEDDENEETEAEEESDEDTSFEAQIGKILKKNNVVHVHQNKDIFRTSKIESHIRKCVQDEAKSAKIATEQNAFMVNVQPQLSTLDYVELDKTDFEFAKEDNKEGKFELSDGSFLHYGNVPSEIKKEQFRQMAEKLRISVKQLASMVLSWTPEERFAGMKRFYLNAYPMSREFYERFSKMKRRNKDEIQESSKRKKFKKSNNDEDEKREKVVDYYENLNTFENVLDLIEDEAFDDRDKATANQEIESKKSDEIDSLFEKFMNNTSEIDPLPSTSKRDDTTIKSNSSNSTVKKHDQDKDQNQDDKYDKLFDKLFE